MLSLFPSHVAMLTVLLFVVCGCGGGSGDQPELGQVTGVVTLDGTPVADVNVEFRPEKGRPSTALTDSTGRYSLSYTGNSAGAIIGTHSVLISTERYLQEDDGSSTHIPEKIPAKYNKNSTLQEEVKAGSNQINFELTSK